MKRNDLALRKYEKKNCSICEGGFSGALNSHQGDFSATRAAAPKHRQPEGDSDAGAAQNISKRTNCQITHNRTNRLITSGFTGSEALPYI